MSSSLDSFTVTATNGTDDTADDKSASCDVTVNRKGQNITAEDVSLTYGDTGTAVSATTDGPRARRKEIPVDNEQ